MDDRDRRRVAAALAAAQRARRHAVYFGAEWERIEAGVDAIAKAIEDVGEQLTGTLQQPGVSAETRAAHPEIPWRAIGGLRNFLAHDYAATEPRRLRLILDDDIAALIPRLEALLGERDEQPRNL